MHVHLYLIVVDAEDVVSYAIIGGADDDAVAGIAFIKIRSYKIL